jgi:hypothetical protein
MTEAYQVTVDKGCRVRVDLRTLSSKFLTARLNLPRIQVLHMEYFK